MHLNSNASSSLVMHLCFGLCAYWARAVVAYATDCIQSICRAPMHSSTEFYSQLYIVVMGHVTLPNPFEGFDCMPGVQVDGQKNTNMHIAKFQQPEFEAGPVPDLQVSSMCLLMLVVIWSIGTTSNFHTLTLDDFFHAHGGHCGRWPSRGQP